MILGDGQKLVSTSATGDGRFGIGFFSHGEAYSKADTGRVLTSAETDLIGDPDFVLDITNKKALLALKAVIESAIAIYDDATNPNVAIRLASILKYKDVHDNVFIA